MIYSFQQIATILNFLKKKQDELTTSFKFKLVKHLNHATSIYIYDETGQFHLDPSEIKVQFPEEFPTRINGISVTDKNLFPPVDLRYINKKDYEENKEYYDSFFDSNSSFEGITRRLSNAFGKFPPIKDQSLPPIVSFYSYKGGVGRTTTLAATASYHARRTGARVLILDCDFEAPGLVNFFGMDEDDLSAKGGIVEYLTDIAYLPDTSVVDISQYIHTISASASKDPLGYAGEKGTIYVMNAGNISVNKINPTEDTSLELSSHQDHYLHGLARIDFGNSDYIVEQFQKMLQHACEIYKPNVILIDSRTGFNDIFNNIALRLSDIVVGFFGTSKQNIPGLYNFLDAISAENRHQDSSLEAILINSIASDGEEGLNEFKNILETYYAETNNELNPETFAIEYVQQMSKIGTPADKGNILLSFTDPFGRYRFPDYKNGNRDQYLEFISARIEKKKQDNSIYELKDNDLAIQLESTHTVGSLSVQNKDILMPLKDFFTLQNISYAENIYEERRNFLDKYYYFRNYLKDIFLRETFIVRGYKGTGKTLLYHALDDKAFTEKLKNFSDISDDFRFVSIIDPSNIIDFRSLNFNPNTLNEKPATYYRRFWIIYIWNVLIQKFSDVYQSSLMHFDVLSDETTRVRFEELMRSDKILTIEFELKKLNEILFDSKIKVVLSFDYLDKLVDPSEWNKETNPISELIKFGQFNPYSSLYPKIFIRTDLFHKTQGINNVNALENKVLSLDWTTEELFAYFFKVVYQSSGELFVRWLLIKNPSNAEYIKEIQYTFEKNDAQIPLEHKNILEFLVNNFFGEYINENIPNFGKSYEWFYANLKNAHDIISLRPFIALLAYCFEKNPSIYITNERPLLPGKYFSSPAARESAAEAYLKDIWKEYPELRLVLETLHKPIIKLDKYRHHLISEYDLYMLIKTIFQLEDQPIPKEDKILDIIKMLENAGIIRYNSAFKKYPYSFAFLYKYYLGLKGSPQK